MTTTFIRAGRAATAFRTQWAKMGPPCPIGTLVHKPEQPPNTLNSLQIFGWHAGPRSKFNLGKQILDGKFHKNHVDIYFGNKHIAAHFGGREDDSVILLVGAPGRTPVDVNEQFDTHYFPGGPDQDVHILEAHKLNPEWVRYVTDVKNQPSFGAKVRASFKEFSTMYSTKIK